MLEVMAPFFNRNISYLHYITDTRKTIIAGVGMKYGSFVQTVQHCRFSTRTQWIIYRANHPQVSDDHQHGLCGSRYNFRINVKTMQVNMFSLQKTLQAMNKLIKLMKNEMCELPRTLTKWNMQSQLYLKSALDHIFIFYAWRMIAHQLSCHMTTLIPTLALTITLW